MSSEGENSLQEELKVNFQLEAAGVSNGKIHGHIQVTPRSPRRLMKKLRLCGDEQQIADLHSSATHLSTSGFNSTRKEFRNTHSERESCMGNERTHDEVTKHCQLSCKGHSCFANPKITFEMCNDEKPPSPVVVIQWYHLGDHKAHRYLLYLDGKLIHQVHMLTDGEISVRLYDLKVGDRHVLELAATMGGNNETYRSDRLAFIVPDASGYDVQVVTVREDRMPPNRSVVRPEDWIVKPPSLDVRKLKPKEPFRCCDLAPHKIFPGIDHYLQSIRRPPSSSKI